MHNLMELLQEHREHTRETYAEIAKNAGLTKPMVYRLATHPLESMPKAETISGLARALGVPDVVVRDVALEALGLGGDDKPDPDFATLRKLYAELSEEDRHVAVRIIESLREAREDDIVRSGGAATLRTEGDDDGDLRETLARLSEDVNELTAKLDDVVNPDPDSEEDGRTE